MNIRIEKFLLWAAVAYVAGALLGYGVQSFLPYLMIEKKMDPATLGMSQALGRLFSAVPIAIVCGIWLKSAAIKEGRSPWTWFFFGLIFTVVGVALFYAVAIYQKLNKEQFEQVASRNPDKPVS